MAQNLVNFGARFEYMTALEVHWPEVLKSLRDDTFPNYQRCFQRESASAALQNLKHLLSASKKSRPAAFRKLLRALRKWALAYGFRNTWIQDLAAQTMYSWATGGSDSKWSYFPEVLDTPRFEPKLGYWIPERQTWPEFKRSSDEIYHREQAKYRSEVRTLWGEGQPKLSQQAVWTVLWQQGKSPGAIQLYQIRTTRQKVTLANIQLRVHAFAKSAGLTLRARRAGPAATI
jgi:hypothetical protein